MRNASKENNGNSEKSSAREEHDLAYLEKVGFRTNEETESEHTNQNRRGIYVVECSNNHPPVAQEQRPDSKKPNYLAPFVIYILCEELKHGMGNTLIDTGSQISLVTEGSLTRGAKFGKQRVQINGITGQQ
jgi:hypothetical protein